MSNSIALYIHIPWCVKKCPYCDFNSHTLKDTNIYSLYFDKLLEDFLLEIKKLKNKQITSIFIGGGTPSLAKPKHYAKLINAIAKHADLANNAEITMELNPGTCEFFVIQDYIAAGINRISIGAQSFNSKHLQQLGRIHGPKEIYKVIDELHSHAVVNFNIDIMHSLSQQSIKEAIADLTTAISLNPKHISWYELTIEPNTLFAKTPPKLPSNNFTAKLNEIGSDILAKAGYNQYEISAYAKTSYQCLHNLNYWQYGDYIGIGAGAHSKITQDDGKIIREIKYKHPSKYMLQQNFIQESLVVATSELSFEYMLNNLRLLKPITANDFERKTSLKFSSIYPQLEQAASLGLVTYNTHSITPTSLGRNFLNNLIEIFI